MRSGKKERKGNKGKIRKEKAMEWNRQKKKGKENLGKEIKRKGK